MPHALDYQQRPAFLSTTFHLDRLAVLIGLHDFGKISCGFQDRIRGVSRGTGHVAEAVAALRANVPGVTDHLFAALRVDLINEWCETPDNLLYAVLCHHGEPVEEARIATCFADIRYQWSRRGPYNPIAEIQALVAALLAAFPRATRSAEPFPALPRFQHALAGLVMTSDWMGSDARWHPVCGPESRPHAASSLLDDTAWSSWHTGSHPAAVLGNRTARAAQVPILSLPLNHHLVVLEAPTGTGKTEAAIIWADRLAAAGLVDGMYFAVPTRSAATELHARVAQAMGQVHPKLLHRVVRAVPGLLDTDHPVSIFDEPSAPTWAIGSSRRVMAAPVAVGTIDQAMLSQMRVRHGHLRAWCLARHLLVIDEVHASDPYMGEIIARLVEEHLALGSYALLMSATLGETMLARIEGRQRVKVENATARSYPLLSAQGLAVPVPVSGARQVHVRIENHADAKRKAAEAAMRGEAVLWIRSTVRDAVDDRQAIQQMGADTLLHHSRYADVDRRYLDGRVLDLLGPNGHRRGVVVVATQTCEQSLDIDADLLVTDACPADVFLQRLGRLHRHRIGTIPTALIVNPGAWDRYVDESGKAVGGPGRGWAWVYNPLAVRETVELVRMRGRICVPDDVRQLVELATHADHLKVRARAHGRSWEALWHRLFGRELSHRQQALAALVDRSQDYSQGLVDGRAPTRLGDGTVEVTLDGALVSPFTGDKISVLAVPARWLRSAKPGSSAVVRAGNGGTCRRTLNVDGVRLVYGEDGLHLDR